jgi:cell division transport system permease protein
MGLKNQLHRARYFCSDAWDEWRHSVWVNLLALLTLVSALFVAGLVLLIVTNVERRVRTLRDDVKIQIYLQDERADEVRLALAERLRANPQVVRVEYVDKDEALRRYREWAADLAELVNELETNPLPASLEVFLAPGAGAAEAAATIAAGLEKDEGVEEVRFNQDWLSRLETLLSLSRVGGVAVIALVFLAVVFVMGSVLRLAVFARQDEIQIMQLVGATPGFIRGPYLVAGAVQGLIASALALLLVEGVRSGATAAADASAAALLDLVAARPLSLDMAGLLLLLGLLVSLTGSYVSVRPSTT